MLSFTHNVKHETYFITFNDLQFYANVYKKLEDL